ncbi:MAG: hypothetical protein ACTSPB_12560 [Candidatus Thorarchaeota archaeon]
MKREIYIHLIGTIIMQYSDKLGSIGMIRTSLILKYLRILSPELSMRTYYRMIKHFKDNMSKYSAFTIGTQKEYRRGRPELRFYYDRSHVDDISSSEFQNRYWAHEMKRYIPI